MDGSEMETTRDDQRHPLLGCFFDFSVDGLLALRFLIYLLPQKKKKRKKKKRIELSSQDFLDSAGFPGINSALRKERGRTVH